MWILHTTLASILFILRYISYTMSYTQWSLIPAAGRLAMAMFGSPAVNTTNAKAYCTSSELWKRLRYNTMCTIETHYKIGQQSLNHDKVGYESQISLTEHTAQRSVCKRSTNWKYLD